MIEVEVAMVRFDQEKIPIVILREKEGRSKRFLPIWIGIFEAVAIIMEMEKQPVERPMTHDLMKSIIDNLGASVISILVSELKNDTFYAEISLRLNDGKVVKVDSRPSDAMALALRANAPIYVSEDVMSKSGINPDIMEVDEKDELKAFLDSLKPEDFESKV